MSSIIKVVSVTLFDKNMAAYVCKHCGKWCNMGCTLSRSCPYCSNLIPNAISTHTDIEYRLKWHRNTITKKDRTDKNNAV